MKASTATFYDESKYELIGIVESVTTRSISAFRAAFASLGSIFGGKNDTLNEKFMKARDDALKELYAKAQDRGADLLIGVSLTTDVMGDFITYAGLGTALRRKDGAVGGKNRKTLKAIKSL